MSDPKDIVVLRTERGATALPLLRVVVSGVASRGNLMMDQLDDVQLAIETLLAEEPEGEGELTLEIRSEGRGLSLCLDGLVNTSLKATLLATTPFHPCEGCLIDVRAMLESLVDAFSVSEKTEGCFAVHMDKRA